MRPVERRPLVGGYVRLEPLSTAHETDLRGIDDPALFRFLPQTPDDFPDWFASALTSRDPLYFAAVMDGAAVGRASVMRMDLVAVIMMMVIVGVMVVHGARVLFVAVSSSKNIRNY